MVIVHCLGFKHISARIWVLNVTFEWKCLVINNYKWHSQKKLHKPKKLYGLHLAATQQQGMIVELFSMHK